MYQTYANDYDNYHPVQWAIIVDGEGDSYIAAMNTRYVGCNKLLEVPITQDVASMLIDAVEAAMKG